MSDKRHAARTDVNEKDIVKALRRLGFSVESGHDDILVGAYGMTFWFEIKDPAKTLKQDGSFRKGAIKPSQERLRDEFRGHYEIVTTLDQILDSIRFRVAQQPQTPSKRANREF